mgnify:CR=1 FL=1
MNEEKVLLDSDTLSFLMKKYPVVVQRYEEYIEKHGFVYIGRVTVFEILNGLKAKHATKQLEKFRSFITQHEILEVTELSVEFSSDAYAELVKKGKHSGFDDLLIAGIALANDLTLVTNNTKDFENIENLRIDNWYEE